MFLLSFLFNCVWVLQFRAHSRYYKSALTQKRSFLVICTTFRSDFFCLLKKSRETFNTKFVIQRSVQMTWTRHVIFLFQINLFTFRLCKYIWKACYRLVFWHELGQLLLCQKCVYLSEWCLCHFVSTLWLLFDKHDCGLNVWILYFICHS